MVSEGNGHDARDAAARALAADRAEAVAQLKAALSMIASVAPPPVRLPPAPAVPPDTTVQAADPPVTPANPAVAAAATELREAARVCLEAAAEVDRLQIRLLGVRPVDEEALEAAQAGLAEVDEARADVPPAWRRTAGSLISGTGMAIIVASLSWPAWAYLVPAALMLVMAADLRVAAAAARNTSIRSAQLLAAAGVAGPDGLERARAQTGQYEAAAAELEHARFTAEAAQARWVALAGDTVPEHVETYIERLSANAAPVLQAADPPPEWPTVSLREEQERTISLAEALAEEARANIARADEALAQLSVPTGETGAEHPGPANR